MLSKNNRQLAQMRSAKQKQRFGLRKLTIGVASVLLGTTFFMGTAYADENTTTNTADTSTPTTTEVAQTKQQQPTAVLNTQNSSNEAFSDQSVNDQGTTTGSQSDSNQTSSANDQSNDQQTLSLNTSSLTNGSTVDPSQLGVSLREESGSTSLTDNDQTNITLTHGNKDAHVLLFNVDAKASDNVTVKVPSIFTPSPDQDSAQGVSVTSTTNSDNSTTLTYHFTKTANNSYSLNIGLSPKYSDWSLLAEGSKYTVDVNKNDSLAAQVTYTIAAPAKITDAKVLLDQYQHTNLVQGQKYPVAIQLPNDGGNDGDNFTGTVTVTVPTGFQLETNGAHGLSYYSEFSHHDSTNAVDNSGITSITQPGGAGTPIVIHFNTKKANLNEAYMLFWGTYTQTISAGDNNFKATVSYQSVDGTQTEAATHVTNGAVKAVNMPVNSTQRSSLDTKMTMPEKIATDNGTANETHQSDNTDSYKYPSGWSFDLQNDGNVAQTNVKLHIDLEPGTVFNGKTINGRVISFTSTGENAGITVVATLNDGTKLTLLNDHKIGVNDNSDSASFASDTAALDGSNVKSLDITFDKINAGSDMTIGLSTLNSILSKATKKKKGDKATYSYTLTSDQGVTKSGTKTIDIVDPDRVEQNISFTGYSGGFTNGTYDKNSTGSSALMNSGQIMYLLAHAKENDSRPSSYLIVIPAGFHVASASDINLMYEGQDLPTTGSGKTGKLTALGAIGPAGEYVYRIDLSFTPGQEGSGHPVYVQKDNSVNIPLAINDDQGPASYDYAQHTAGNAAPNPYPVGIALLMEINPNSDIAADNFQSNDAKTVTLGGVTYPVVMESLGWHESGWVYTDAEYSFVAPSTYGTESGVKNDHEASYHSNDSTSKAEFTYSDKANGVPDITYTTGKLKMTNILTDGGTSKYSYNVVNLPATTDGDTATLTLTGAGSIVGNASTSQLLYSTTPLTKTTDLTAADLANYVEASQVTDWSKIRSVLLKSGQLSNNTVINAYVPFKVTGMAAGLKETSLNLPNVFTGDHKNSTFNSEGNLPIHITRYVTVTTNWVKQAADGTQTAIKKATSENVKAGDAYTTSGLTASEIPAGYKLQAQPTNASGTTDAEDVDVTYVYVQDAQSATLNFVDDTDSTNTPAPSITANGANGSAISFKSNYTDAADAAINNKTPQEIVDYLESEGYELVKVTNDGTGATLSTSDWATIFGDYDDDDSVDQTFTIHLKHGVKTVNKDNPGTPNSPINPNDPRTNKPTYPTGTAKKDLTKSVTRTIHYVTKSADGTKTEITGYPTVDQTVTFDATGYIDEVTGKWVTSATDTTPLADQTKWASWTADGTDSFAAKTSPAIAHYAIVDVENATGDKDTTDSSNQKDIKAINNVASDASSYDVYVVYAPITQAATLSFVDDDDNGRVIATAESASGDSGSAITFDDVAGAVKKLTGKHYVPSKVTNDTTNKTLSGTDWSSIFGNYDSDDATTQKFTIHFTHATKDANRSKKVTETIHYQYANGDQAEPYYTKTLTFNQSGTTDLVTKKTSYGDWDAAQTFKSVDSPAITGYTADPASVDAQTITVTNDNYGNDLDITKTVTYTADDQNAKITYIDDTTGKTLTSDTANGKFGKTISFTTSPAQRIANYEQQGYELVSNDFAGQTYQADNSKNQFTVHLKHGTKAVTRDHQVIQTINYVYADGSKAADSNVQTLTFHETGTRDKVTQQDTWTAAADQSFSVVVSPVITGYTPDKVSVPASEANFDSQDNTITVTYTADDQNAKITYIDDTTGKALTSDTANGKFGKTISFTTSPAKRIANYEQQGYELVSNDFAGQTYQADNSKNQFTVHLKHGTEAVTRDHDVKQTIHYVFANGTKAADDAVQTLHFVENGTRDKVTDAYTWTTAANQSFKSTDSPVINGYTPDKANVPVSEANFDSQDKTVTVTYTANDQAATITYIDDTTGKVLKTDKANGKFGDQIKFTTAPADQIATYEGAHYDLVSNNFDPADTYQSDNSKNNFVVHLTHHISNYQTTKTATRTINYVFDDGSTHDLDAVHQTVTFTGRGQRDQVTGKLIGTLTWTVSAGDPDFTKVVSPSVKGYHIVAVDSSTAGQQDGNDVKSMTANQNTGDIVVNVHYAADTMQNVSESKTVHETIHYVYSDGQKAHDDYVATPITFTRHGVKDVNTNTTEWGAWTPTTGTFASVTSPEITGYTADQPSIASQSVTENSHDLEFTVTYTTVQQPVTPVQPTTPTTPVTPTTPTTPTTPETPTTPTQNVTPVQPTESSQPVTPTTSSKTETTPVENTAKATTEKKAAAPQQKLPQTGNDDSAALLGLGLTSLIGLFGLGKRRKKQD